MYENSTYISVNYISVNYNSIMCVDCIQEKKILIATAIIEYELL